MGTWSGCVLVLGCAALAVPRQADRDARSPAPERRDPSSGIVTGLVRDLAGAPVEGAWVLLESDGGVAHDVSGVLARSARGVEPEATLVLEVVPTAAVQVVGRGRARAHRADRARVTRVPGR